MKWIVLAIVVLFLLGACQPPASTPAPTPLAREDTIPASATKISPATDEHPPQVLVADYQQPVPLPGSVNTAGAEDSPFILPDGQTLYFFFTPDLNIPVEKQVTDGVTGIYTAHLADGQWRNVQRVVLQDPGKLAMDGCEFVQGNVMWFCSAREGYTGLHWFRAEFQDGSWQNWQLADFPADFQVGELHFSADGNELYFHSDRPGGKGGLDLWVSQRVDGVWQEPVNLAVLNTTESEGWPALSPDGNELWFTRNYGVWRSRKVAGDWQAPMEIVTSLAGEPSIDQNGNLYFVHHYLQGNQIVEADLYVAYKNQVALSP